MSSVDLAKFAPLLQQPKKIVAPTRDGGTVEGIEACCPFHSESTPSFRIYANGGANCFGCGGSWHAAQVAKELGFELDGESDWRQETEYRPVKLLQHSAIYSDRDGDVLKVDVYRDGNKKSVLQLHWQEAQQNWVRGAPDRLLPPYRFLQLLQCAEDQPIYWAEGEKCVHTLEQLGKLATTTAGGVNSLKRTDPDLLREALSGRTVYILPDYDVPGEKYASDVRDLLKELGANPFVVHLPHLKNKGDDVADYVARGGTVEELDRCAEMSVRQANGNEPVTLEQSLNELAEDIDSAKHAEKFHTGLSNLDKLLKGLRRKTVTVLGGEPGAGKTALAMQIALLVAGNYDTTGGDCLIFSQEMDRVELAERLCAWYYDVDVDSVTSAHARSLAKQFKQFPLSIIDHRVTVAECERECQIWALRSAKPALVIIDYLQLLDWGPKRDEYSFLGDATPRIKAIAKNCDCHVIELAHLGKTAGDRDKPSMRDFKGNSSIEQDADKAVILRHREATDNPVIGVDAYVLKNRRGKLGVAHLEFDRPHYKFTDSIDARREGGYDGSNDELEFF